MRAGDLEQLGQIAIGHPSRERFLAELTLETPDASGANSGSGETPGDSQLVRNRKFADSALEGVDSNFSFRNPHYAPEGRPF